MDQSESAQTGYVQSKLPWIIGLLAFAFYFLTKSHSVTLTSLTVVSKITGWDWSPMVNAPVFYLLTLPFSYLPPSMQFAGMNTFAALLASLTLFNLSRSVILLPHDRTRDQRVREQSDFSLLSLGTSWVPPLFAAMICGLQLTFWEHATAITGEMIDLLMFSYLIRCLLEYRISENEKWLMRMAFIYGLSITNNWAMIPYFPLFLGALIWIMGISFFQGKLLLKSAALGLLGMSLYAVLPIVIVSQYPESGGLLDYLKLQLGSQKAVLTGFTPSVVIVLSLTSIVPVMAMGVRWPSSFGDTSAAGAMLTNFMFRLIHMVFLGACLWIAFDPPFSPRVTGQGIPYLSFYYLGALAIGYYSGYALLIFSQPPARSKSRRHRGGGNYFIGRACKVLVILASVLCPLCLVVKNWQSIRLTNSDLFARFAQAVIQELPQKGGDRGILLADDPIRSLIVKFGLFQSKGHVDSRYTIVDTSALDTPFYQAWIRGQIVDHWSQIVGSDNIPKSINLGSVMNVIANVYENYPIFYLQSSFGFYFEYLYPKPLGFTLRMEAYTAGDARIYPPAMLDQELNAGLTFWEAFDEDFSDLRTGITADVPLCLALGAIAGMERNNWGVILQRHGKLEEAKHAFKQASAYASEIESPSLNLQANVLLSNEELVTLIDEAKLKVLINKFRSIDRIIQINGEFDEPRFQYELGAQFFAGGNFRQAASRFSRAIELNPNEVLYWLAKANTLLSLGFPKELLESLTQLGEVEFSMDSSQKAEVTRLTALGHYGFGNKQFAANNQEEGKKEFQIAEGLLLKARDEFPKSERIVETLSQVYFFTERYAEAVGMCQSHLLLNPDSGSARQTMAISQMRAGLFNDAIKTLDDALSRNASNLIALQNRAICYLQLKELEQALKDYTSLENAVERESHVIHYGLAEIARLQGRQEEAIKHFSAYLGIAPKGTPEYEKVTEFMAKLQGE
jgi:tetratricopeptide (TPR) repeat protein